MQGGKHMSSGLRRNLRYWLWNMEGLFIVQLVIAAALAFVLGIFGAGEKIINYIGFELMIIMAFWVLEFSMSIRLAISVGMMMSANRADNLRALHIATFLYFLQTECVQLVLWLVLPQAGNTQRMVVFYTPVCSLFAAGFSYLLMGIGVEHERIQKIILLLFSFLFGCTASFLGVFSTERPDSLLKGFGEIDSRFFFILLFVSVVFCLMAVLYMRKKVRYMDVRA